MVTKKEQPELKERVLSMIGKLGVSKETLEKVESEINVPKDDTKEKEEPKKDTKEKDNTDTKEKDTKEKDTKKEEEQTQEEPELSLVQQAMQDMRDQGNGLTFVKS